MLHDIGVTYYQIGLGYRNRGDFEEAEHNYKKAIEWNQRTKQLHRLWSDYGVLGLLYKEMNLFKKALECYSKAMQFLNDHQIKERAITIKALRDLLTDLSAPTRQKAEAILNQHKELLDSEESDKT